MKIIGLCGTNPYPFERFVCYFERLAEDSDWDLTFQAGNSRLPKGCDGFHFSSRERILKAIEGSHLVVSQAGYGTCLDALMIGKPLIVVPRQQNLGECLDNQLELARSLDSMGRADIASSYEALVQVAKDYERVLPDRREDLSSEIGSAVASEIRAFLSA